VAMLSCVKVEADVACGGSGGGGGGRGGGVSGFRGGQGDGGSSQKPLYRRAPSASNPSKPWFANAADGGQKSTGADPAILRVVEAVIRLRGHTVRCVSHQYSMCDMDITHLVCGTRFATSFIVSFLITMQLHSGGLILIARCVRCLPVDLQWPKVSC
jgi:hypothetical protein